MKKTILICILAILTSFSAGAKDYTDANIFGHVIGGSEHLPYASVFIKGTTIGVATDNTGHYRMINLPIGELTIVAKVVGFKAKEVNITTKRGKTLEINFELEEDILGLNEVVITGDRNEINRIESPVIVTALPAKLLTSTQSISISEGLNYCPGLRVENDCQNCGFTQLRINGMGGAYSQILINSRPIFSGLAGVYGLELIPTNMVERIEIVRGGGSALYGSNAIAGTVNIILKDPINNNYEVGTNFGWVGTKDAAFDQGITANASIVSDDNKSGMSLYAFHRNREAFDANGDDFTELSEITNTTFGTRLYHSIDIKSKLSADFFIINEDRRGGNKLDYPEHESDIAESLKHNIKSVSITYDRFFRTTDLFSTYVSVQNVDRDSYYGTGELEDYGHTKSFTYVAGANYKANFKNSNLIIGFENQGEWLDDKKLGYTEYTVVLGNLHKEQIPNNIIADQISKITGGFTQFDYKWNAFKLAFGFRFDHYEIKNKALNNIIRGNVFSPRLNILYNLSKSFQLRASYSKGYRAPQIFDEDLHIASSESRKIIIQNDPNLKQETSHSFMGSIDFHQNTSIGNVEILFEFFYTKLNNPFANEYGNADYEGRVIYTRRNAEDGAVVKGINTEFTFIPSSKLNFIAGFTLQSSSFNEPQPDFRDKKFHRSPNNYGFMNLQWVPNKKWELSVTANYTGSMIVPYFGVTLPDPEAGELRKSKEFMDIGFKLSRTIKLKGNNLQLYAGVKNIFNSYQDDFDIGADRDPGYIYGPGNPRTIYIGIKLGNLIK